MTSTEQAIFLKIIANTVANDPSLLRPIVDAATEGVKAYAESQSEKGTHAQFRLMCVLQAIQPPPDGKFGPFTSAEVVNCLSGCFEGTAGLDELRAKFGVQKKVSP